MKKLLNFTRILFLRNVNDRTRLSPSFHRRIFAMLSVVSRELARAWNRKFVPVAGKGQDRPKTIMGCLAVTVTVLRRRRRGRRGRGRRRKRKRRKKRRKGNKNDEKKREEKKKGKKEATRPDTRPPVADEWAGAEMRVFTLFDSCSPTDRRTDGRTDGRTKPLIELRVRN